MYINLDDYLPYSDSLSESFETKTNPNLRCCYGYPKI